MNGSAIEVTVPQVRASARREILFAKINIDKNIMQHNNEGAMPSKIELTAAQLAGLDLVIAKKQEDPNWLAGEAVMPFDNIAKATTALLAAVALVGANRNIASHDTKGALTAIKNASLAELLEIRKNAILKK